MTSEWSQSPFPPPSPGISQDFDFPINQSMQNVLQRITELERENQKLRMKTLDDQSPKRGAEIQYQVFHCFKDNNYLDEPTWSFGGSHKAKLHAVRPVGRTSVYLEQHPHVAFVVFKYYDPVPGQPSSPKFDDEGVASKPTPNHESIEFTTDEMKDAVTSMTSLIPEFSTLFPFFNVNSRVSAPYLIMYTCYESMKETIERLPKKYRKHIRKFYDVVMASHGKQFSDAKEQFARGIVSLRSVDFLIQPGSALVSGNGQTAQGFMATSWPGQVNSSERFRVGNYTPSLDSLDIAVSNDDTHLVSTAQTSQIHPANNGNAKVTVRQWTVDLWSWNFTGSFERKQGSLDFTLRVKRQDEEFEISKLEIYPLRFADIELKTRLSKRGTTFWKLRERRFVSYREDNDVGFTTVDERYMIDMATYKRLHSAPNQTVRQGDDKKGKLELGDGPPKGNALHLFPPTIIGYNMRLKKWVDLYVDKISDVTWNKQAFQNLVIDPQSKELVEALIGSKLSADKATDLIVGKGNGLIILLHGGPGTGKTFTAEGVAEFAEKPLYRVTCGDVGTSPEAVEKYLQSVLHLGKIWDCVVLIDEADVFLEERVQADLNRNALVSVFLRCLEYYDGILILTSNRVGTFDEAFKSRIQLSLHYERLTEPQRRKIWRNFIMRLRDLDNENVDCDDVTDHIEELGKHPMNGREIRNALTTARQLAQYKKQVMTFEHLKHVIGVANRFNTYLSDLRDGLSDEQIKRDDGVR